MKTKTYIFIALLFFSSSLMLLGQASMTIKPGGAVTVNGNLTITPTAFVPGTPFTDTRDGQSYNTVVIGTQCWMAQNLNIGTKILGVSNQTNNSIIEKYCYNNDDANCAIYGGLYQWNELMEYGTNEGGKGICPTGWHLPTDAEWATLATYLGGQSIAGGKMKETGIIHWLSPNEYATNSSGFTALPGGLLNLGHLFTDLTIVANFWTSSGSDDKYFRYLRNNSEYVYVYYSSRAMGFSARCLKD